MTNERPTDATRVTKREFIKLVAQRAGAPVAMTSKIYEAALAEVVAQVRAGRHVNWSGFGRFHRQLHRGAPSPYYGGKQLPAYWVLKFSASRPLSNLLGLSDAALRGRRVPGTTLILNDDGETTDGGRS